MDSSYKEVYGKNIKKLREKANLTQAELAKKAEKWLNVHDIFEESVRTGESHGVTDKGTVVDHQYLILTQRD